MDACQAEFSMLDIMVISSWEGFMTCVHVVACICAEPLQGADLIVVALGNGMQVLVAFVTSRGSKCRHSIQLAHVRQSSARWTSQ
jgi:hypothetical protein